MTKKDELKSEDKNKPSTHENEKEAKNPRGKIRDEMNILLKDIKEDNLLFDAICSIKKTYQK